MISMDFDKLFAGMGLEKPGISTFYELHKRTSDKEFQDSVDKAWEAFQESDEAFGEYLNAMSEQEKVEPELLNLYLYLRFCEYTLDKFREMGIEAAALYEAMTDMTKKCEVQKAANGIYGIPQNDQRAWLRYHINGVMFQFGRLQFQKAVSEYDLEIEGMKVAKGDLCFYVHIPRSTPLTQEACMASYKEALAFARKHFGVDKMVCFCYSWTLQPWLLDKLDAQTNIIKYQKSYEIIETIESLPHMFPFIFPKEYDNLDDYPVDTTLRRAAIERRRKGGIIGYGVGVKLITDEMFER